MPKLFRQLPPKEHLDAFVKVIGLRDLSDHTWFEKQQPPLTLIPIYTEIEPYYYPCKAKQFLQDTTKYITVLRQLLHEHGYILAAEEKTVMGVKGYLCTF